MNPFDCHKLDVGNGPETISEIYYRSLGRKPSSRNYYKQALFIFSEGDASISMKRRHLNITTQFVEEKFSTLSSIENISISLLIIIYRNWLFNKSRKQNYNQTKETQMNESTEQLIQQLHKEDLWTETLTLINEELVKRMSSPDRRVKLIAQLHFDEFDISTTKGSQRLLVFLSVEFSNSKPLCLVKLNLLSYQDKPASKSIKELIKCLNLFML